LEAWYWSILYYILFFIAALIILIVVIYTFTLTGNLILAPFNDLLSEKVESIYSGNRVEETFKLGIFIKDMVRSYRAEGGRIILYLLIFVSLLSLNLLPLVGTAIYGISVVIYSFFFLCWEFLDYPMERWRFSFRVKRRLAFKNLFVFISFGAGAALLLLIPLVNLAAIPLCVAGATILFCDLRREGRLLE